MKLDFLNCDNIEVIVAAGGILGILLNSQDNFIGDKPRVNEMMIDLKQAACVCTEN